MKTILMMLSASLLVLMACAAALAEDNMQCTNYSTVCEGYSCYAISGTCDNDQAFNRLSQPQIVLGSCTSGTGSCEETGHPCSAKKYLVDGIIQNCAATDLVCTDEFSGHMGCQ